MFVAEAVCFGGELEPKSGIQCGALVVPRGSGGCRDSGNYRVERTWGERVGVGLAGSEAGQGELSVATKSLLGQGPWQRLARGIRAGQAAA